MTSTQSSIHPADQMMIQTPVPYTVLTDLTVSISDASSASALDPQTWRRLEKDLLLHLADQSAYLHVQSREEGQLTRGETIILDVKIGDSEPDRVSHWEKRPGGIWLLRGQRTGIADDRSVSGVDVLFGADAVDPRPGWTLLDPPLHLDASIDVPVAKLTVRRGRPRDEPPLSLPKLSASKEDGTFRIVQISDTHMVTGPGTCKDAIDADGNPLPPMPADPSTVTFVGSILDIEKPDLVVLAGDQLHHDIPDSQTALFKVTAPMIERRIPYAIVFGNHDSEGALALSRKRQMDIYRSLPYSVCASGPEHVDGECNYFLQLISSPHTPAPFSTLFFLDSHGELPTRVKSPDYEWITQSQIDWFTQTSRTLRNGRLHDSTPAAAAADPPRDGHISLAFLHIPLPELADESLVIRGGKRREPTEGPSFNSRFYDVLRAEGVAALGCAHDHVNDFCTLVPEEGASRNEGRGEQRTGRVSGPWLCYGGGTGFGGYCSYGENRYHRRARVWEIDSRTGSLRTWKRIEYNDERADELLLVKDGQVIA